MKDNSQQILMKNDSQNISYESVDLEKIKSNKSKKNDPNQLAKKIRKKKSKNNDHLLVRKKEYQMKPITVGQSQQYQYHLFNDIIVDFDLIHRPQNDLTAGRGQLWSNFKRITQVNIINDGTMMEYIQENINQPILNMTPVINMLQQQNTQQAYLLAKDLFQVNEYRQNLSNYLRQMNTEHRINLFAQRRDHSMNQCDEIIKNFSHNNMSMFHECIYNDKQQTHEYRRMGFSKKFLSLLGIDIKDGPSILLRRGFIDVITKQQQALYVIKRNVLPLYNKNMPEITEFQMESEYYTLEGIHFNCILHIRVHNTTRKFDQHLNIDMPIKPDTITEISIEIPQESILKIYDIRRQLNLFNKYSLDDYVNGEFKYLVQVENFLEKYYNTPYIYRKGKNSLQKDNKKSLIIQSETTTLKSQSDNNNMFDSENSNSCENIQENQQHPSSYSFTQFKENFNGCNSKHSIHPSIKNICFQKEQTVDEGFGIESENLSQNQKKFESPELYIQEYKYNPMESKILSNTMLTISNN